MVAFLLRCARRLRPYAPEVVIAGCAVALAWTFAVAVLQHTESFGLPLEDAYIYLTYAKQFGRGEPFTYYSGGGYSAGSTSVLWPMLLAPFWALGARGHALVWVSFGMCSALYAATCIGCYRIVREIGGVLTGAVAAALVLAIAPFAWTALSGMEVGFASALLVCTILLLMRASREGPPSRLLIACLAATSLSRPEALLIVVAIVLVSAWHRLRQRDLRACAWWMAPVIAPLLWLLANRVFAGHWFPNTGVAKSHFYLPGFDWTYWWNTVPAQSGRMLRALFWDSSSPLVAPRLVGFLWIIGAARVLVWARSTRRWLVALLIIGAPFALVLAVIASSGAWNFHNYRYIAAAFPLFMVVAACALSPIQRSGTSPSAIWVRRAWIAAMVVFSAWFLRAALPLMRADIALFAQNAVDLNRQVVTIGRYVGGQLPNASIMFHDAGAIAYYGDRPVYDMLGLVTNHQAHVANNGPGARFEFLESLPAERRPTHFAYYPGWMGQDKFFGDVVLATPLAPAFHRRRLIGDHDMRLIVANWDRVHTAERPFVDEPGWHLVDRVDIADVDSEVAHRWAGALGRRAFGDPTARWSVFHEETRSTGLALDGGRTIRGAAEQFEISVDPTKSVRIVMRTGGNRSYPYNEPIARDVSLVLRSAEGTELGRMTLPSPSGTLVEITFEMRLAASKTTVRVLASGPYRVFHWFVLQPG